MDLIVMWEVMKNVLLILAGVFISAPVFLFLGAYVGSFRRR
jgi:hypothetical protein